MSRSFRQKLLLLVLLLALIGVRPVSALTITGSETITVTAIVGTVPPNPLDDRGGGPITNLIFSGLAYPLATVHVWKDGTPEGSAVADSKGIFKIILNETYSPNALYTLYAIDKLNRRSVLVNYPIVVRRGYVTEVSGIKFAPTISTDKTEVKVGDYITVSGYALPSTALELTLEGTGTKTFHLTSSSDGQYKITIPLLDMGKGIYDFFVNYINDKKISKIVSFTIGDNNILSIELTTNIPGDCNADQVINLVDFSVVAFWYGKDNPPRCVDTNSDNIINLVDFSILAFYWTG